jgi:hypothetical protein
MKWMVRLITTEKSAGAQLFRHRIHDTSKMKLSSVRQKPGQPFHDRAVAILEGTHAR